MLVYLIYISYHISYHIFYLVKQVMRTQVMRTQNWPIADLQQLDRETQKIMVEKGGKHPLGSKALLYLPREVRGRGLKCVENEHKLTKIKAAVNLCQNQDSTMKVVRVFEERSADTGHN